MASIEDFNGAEWVVKPRYLEYCLTLDTALPYVRHFHNFLKTFWNYDKPDRIEKGLAELETAISFGDTPNGDIAFMIGWLTRNDDAKTRTYLNNAINKGNGDAAYVLAEHYYYGARDYDKVAEYIRLIQNDVVRPPIIHIFWDDWYADKAPYMFRTVITFTN
jgi:TPR repeat protein